MFLDYLDVMRLVSYHKIFLMSQNWLNLTDLA